MSQDAAPPPAQRRRPAWPTARQRRRVLLALLPLAALVVGVGAATADHREDDDEVASPPAVLTAFSDYYAQRTAAQAAIDGAYGPDADLAGQSARLADAAGAHERLADQLDELALADGGGPRAEALSAVAAELRALAPLLRDTAEQMAAGGLWMAAAECGRERLDADIRLGAALERLTAVYEASFLLATRPDARRETVRRRTRCALALELFSLALEAVPPADQLALIPLLTDDHQHTLERLSAWPQPPADAGPVRLEAALRRAAELELADLRLRADALRGQAGAEAERAAALPALEQARTELRLAFEENPPSG